MKKLDLILCLQKSRNSTFLQKKFIMKFCVEKKQKNYFERLFKLKNLKN